MKLGKKPATPDGRDLLAERYIEPGFPQAPIGFTHTALVKAPWGMLGNDEWGDCAWAGPGHEHMLTSATAGNQVSFTDADILKGYESTGFDPNAGPPGDNPTDQGSDVRDVLKYRASTGLVDAAGHTHTIGAYAALKPGDWSELLQALQLFETVGVGIQFPGSAMTQFNNGEPWDVVPHAKIEGGHYIPVVARPLASMVDCVTWGKLQPMTRAFYEKYCDEAWAILSPEAISGGKTIDGFNLQQLTADLAAL